MQQPLVIAYHLIWTAYGSWLPNDPRGSGSEVVRNEKLEDLGEIHHGRKPVQPRGNEIRQFYARADDILQHPKIIFDENQIDTIAESFGNTIETQKYTVYACAIMPDHVHLVIRKHKDTAEEMANHLMYRSRLLLVQRQLVPDDHRVWIAGTGWNVFLDHPQAVWRTIRYVEDNPIKAGRSKQTWPFVKEYDNWPLHPGHNPNSPYAKRLRLLGKYPE